MCVCVCDLCVCGYVDVGWECVVVVAAARKDGGECDIA
jgi:hypothetical protein